VQRALELDYVLMAKRAAGAPDAPGSAWTIGGDPPL
jgi:hypothetical protein